MAAPAPITDGLVAQLKDRLESSEVLTPSSPGYDEAIKRWSDAAVKQAVCLLEVHHRGTSVLRYINFLGIC